MEDVLMSEIEKKAIDEMGADEMLEAFGKSERAEEAKRILEAAEEPHEEGETEGRNTEDWVREMMQEFDVNAKRWHRRQGWEAFCIAGFHALSVVACCAALLGCYWQLVLVGMAAANLLMVGGWLNKARAGWQV